MKYRFLILFFCFPFSSIHSQEALTKFSYTQNKMGSPFTILFYHHDSIQANFLANQAFSLVDSLTHIFSNYDSSSEISQVTKLSKHNPTKVSKPLWELLTLSENAYKKSIGSFDISIGALTKFWRLARKNHQFPDKQTVENIQSYGGFHHLILNPSEQTLSIQSPKLEIDFGGIAKGWIAAEVLHFFSSHQINIALIDAGGDMAMSNSPPLKKGWTIGINFPGKTEQMIEQTLEISNLAVATSGDAYQYMEHNGKRYSHILNPKTGYGSTFQRNVTVITKNAAEADWLATACSILPLSQAMQLANQLNASLLITELQKGKIVYHTSDHFKKYFANFL